MLKTQFHVFDISVLIVIDVIKRTVATFAHIQLSQRIDPRQKVILENKSKLRLSLHVIGCKFNPIHQLRDADLH